MHYDVVIVGGGPAGMMAGLLFARAGIETLVLEKHGDFLRDFRGDTVHPSTMEILEQLRMLERFLARPHNRVEGAELTIAGQRVLIGDLRYLNTPAPFIAMMPQWDFLDFLKIEAAAFPAFHLAMEQDVTGFLMDNARITGVKLATGAEHRANKLVIMADGRNSLVRKNDMLPISDLGAPMDVLWFAIPKSSESKGQLRGVVNAGNMMVQIDRGDYWQCAMIIPKGHGDAIKAEGIAAMRARIQKTIPEIGNLGGLPTSMDQFHLLTVKLDRLDRWYHPGLLAIGDAAHAMSPIGGIGINLAIQDAVAAANILAEPMRRSGNVDDLLSGVQKKRLLPTRIMQAGQKLAQDFLITAVMRGGAEMTNVPWPIRLLNRFPLLRRIPGRAIGLGFRREKVSSPAI